MRPLLWIIAALLVSLLACAKDDPLATAPPSSTLGTPLTAAGAIEQQSPLLWSEASNEVIAVASFNAANSNALLAIDGGTGALRTLDARASAPLALAPGGGLVHYVTIDIDSTVARGLALTGAPTARRVAGCNGTCLHVVVPLPDGDLVAVRSNNADSIAIVRLSTGERDTITDGYPLAFSPDGELLLKKDLLEPLSDAVIFDRISRTSAPANLGVLDSVAAYRVLWDATGIHVLFVHQNRRLLLDRRATGATDTLYAASDTLEPFFDAPAGVAAGPAGPLAPRHAGHAIAFWTSRASGGGRVYELRAVDHGVPGHAVAIASTSQPIGNLIVSPGGTAVAYVVDRRLYRSTIPAHH